MKNPRNRIVWLVVLAFMLTSLRTTELQAQDVTASETVTIKDNKKNATWSGKAIKDVTVATLNVHAGNDFVDKSAKPVGASGKWTTPINNTKQAQFKGLLAGAKDHKYAPAFKGDFQSKGWRKIAGNKPVWNVETSPAIALSGGHEYLKFEFQNYSTPVQGTYVPARKPSDFPVDVALTSTNKVAPDYYNAAEGRVRHKNRIVTGDYSTAIPVISSCACDSDVTCIHAVTAVVPLNLTCTLEEIEIVYPNAWVQDTPNDPKYDPNVNPVAGAAATRINKLIEEHEKAHQADFQGLMNNTGIFSGTITIRACAGNQTTSRKVITDNYSSIINIIFQEKISAAQKEMEQKYYKASEDQDVIFINSIGGDGEEWRKTKKKALVSQRF